MAVTSKDDAGKFVIQMSPSISGFRRFWKQTLLHEMAHVSLWLNNREKKLHGPAFKKEMLRILQRGAIKFV
jgi:predicted SprT family Zn-dependent metalloprotease